MPKSTIGVVINNNSSVPLKTSSQAGQASWKEASHRYWFGQVMDMDDLGSAASFRYGGGRVAGSNPVQYESPNPPIPPSPPNLKAAVSGLISVIWNDENGNPKKQDPRKDDKDLAMHRGLKGSYVGFNIIAIDRHQGMICILTKPNFFESSLFKAQDALFASGADRALLTDGGSSTACYVENREGRMLYKYGAFRHSPGFADGFNLVTNYLVFKPRGLVVLP